MPITLPTLPQPGPLEKGPYCVIAKHRAKPGMAAAYGRRMLADLKMTRAEPKRMRRDGSPLAQGAREYLIG